MENRQPKKRLSPPRHHHTLLTEQLSNKPPANPELISAEVFETSQRILGQVYLRLCDIRRRTKRAVNETTGRKDFKTEVRNLEQCWFYQVSLSTHAHTHTHTVMNSAFQWHECSKGS